MKVKSEPTVTIKRADLDRFIETLTSIYKGLSTNAEAELFHAVRDFQVSIQESRNG